MKHESPADQAGETATDSTFALESSPNRRHLSIPTELKALRRWVCWQYDTRHGKRTKVPKCPATKRNAKVNDPADWASFEEAVAESTIFNGVGFVFADGDPFVGVDFDGCLDAEGNLVAWAKPLVAPLTNTYHEVSPSGRGLKFFARGMLPPGTKHKKTGFGADGTGAVEIYASGRYFTVTGRGAARPVAEIDFAQFLALLFPQAVPDLPVEMLDVRVSTCLSDDEIIDRAAAAKNRDRFSRLWNGKTGEDHSADDLSLCNILAFWCQRDGTQMDRIFRRSALYREKWDERHAADGSTYGQLTITKAITSCGEVYKPRQIIERKKLDTDIQAAEPDGRPHIQCGGNELETVNSAVCALVDNSPDLFARTGQLVRVVEIAADQGSGSIKHAVGTPRIETLPLSILRIRLSDSAIFEKYLESRDRWKPTCPPDFVVKAVADLAYWPGINTLRGIAEHPTIRSTGEIVQKQGYDTATGILHRWEGDWPQVPGEPTRADAQAAVEALRDAVCDFPFEAPAHFSAWISGVLTTIARQAISGPTPMFAIEANTRGTGKSRLAHAAAAIATGREFSTVPNAIDDNDMRKTITALALEGATSVLVDNIAGPMGTPSLDAAITSTSWKDRILGQSKTTGELPLYVSWWATGNNIQYKGDISRRVVPIRLFAREERPEERDGFRHDPLIPWVIENRRRLLVSALTILRAWHVSGRPTNKLRRFGSFEEWSTFIREPLVWLGMPDPCDTREAVAEDGDPDRDLLSVLVSIFRELDPCLNGMTASEIIERLLAEGEQTKQARTALVELIGKGSELPSARSLGRYLKQLRGRVVGAHCIEMKKDRKGFGIWFLKNISAEFADYAEFDSTPYARKKRDGDIQPSFLSGYSNGQTRQTRQTRQSQFDDPEEREAIQAESRGAYARGDV